MPWRPLQSGLRFAICVYPFHATQPDDLPLQIGDQIYIIEQGGRCNEWYRGYLLSPPSLLAGLTSDQGQQLEHRVFTGIFPSNCVEVREIVGEGRITGRDAEARQEGYDGTQGEEEDGKGEQQKRKDQAVAARRLSRALNKRASTRSLAKKDKSALIDLTEPIPRDKDAPKPLAPVPLLRVGDETGASAEEPLVDEIASCLREWHDARLHEILLARGYSQLAHVQDLIKRLDTSRKQLLHDVMTTRELNTLREDTVWDLVAGNKLLEDEVIVRSPTEKGRILTSEDSVIEMTRLQANMSILDRPPKAPVDLNMLYHVLVDVRNLAYADDSPASLHMHLCTKNFGEKLRPVTESYSISLPLPHTPSEEPADLAKTLYTELSASDVGNSGDATQVFLIFKLIKDEPLRKGTPMQPSISGELQNGPRSRGSVKERRSILGSQKRNTHSRNTSDVSFTPDPPKSAQFDTNGRPGSTANGPSPLENKTAKRVAGLGAIELTHLSRNQSELTAHVTLWTPCPLMDDMSGGSEDWSEVVRELSGPHSGGYARVGAMKRLDIFAATFASADLDSLIRNTPTLLHNIHPTPKLGFSGVPSKKRSDIYLTFAGPVIEGNPCLQHSKYGNVPLQQRCQSNLANLQLTLEVRRANGERLEECVFTASNQQGHTAWRTTAIERGDGWNQTIKLAIPTTNVPGSHVVMSLADSPNFPFALGWIPLWESGAFVRDGDHQVVLYVYDEYSSSIIGGKGAYLSLPPWHKKEHQPAYGSSVTVTVGSYLCSTEYSQDLNLLGLMRWRDYHGAQLIELLERFSFIPEIEVVKLLGDVFNALFEILHEYAHSESYEDIIFYNFVLIMGIARDRRFNLTNVVEQYAATVHDWPDACACLLRAYYRLLTNPLDPTASRRLRATLKVGDQMLRLIIETKRTRSEAAQGIMNGDSHDRYERFSLDLENFFVAIMALLRNPMPILLGTQTLIVQYFASWVPQLEPVMAPADIMEICTNLLDACAQAQGKMVMHRLILIVNFSHLELFKGADVREALISNTFRWLAPYWGRVDEVDNQWRDQVRLCCSVVATQMEELGDESCQYVPKLVESYIALEKVKRTPKRTFSLLFPSSHPFPTRSVSREIDIDEAMLEISALLAVALGSNKRLYFDANQVDVPGILLQALKVNQSVLNGDAFPKSWLSLHVSHHRNIMAALERISEILIECLPDSFAPDAAEAIEFDTPIWRAFFDTLFATVSSPAIAMETFPEQKRRAVWKIAGDVREVGASLIRRTWEAIGWEADEESKALHNFDRLGGYQVQFVPDLVPAIVEICLSVHASLRGVAVEVLRSMIVSTWEIDEDLSIIQSATINCLDKICRSEQVTKSMLQKTFIDEVVAQFRPLQHTVEDSLYNAVVLMFGKIEQLLGMLANVHHGEGMNEANKIMDTLSLMQFFKDVHSNDAYVRYVHRLADFQAAAGYHTEAGLALKLHADRYDWDPSTNVAGLGAPEFPAQTAFERKEALYFEMCKHFEAGQSWAPALATYKELAVQYESTTFDFSKLARAHRAMAAIHEKIARGERVNPRYFRVVFKGLGFSVNLLDREFIFEALPTDRQAMFEERLQQMYPSAQILRNAREADVEGQFIQIFPVSPHKDLEHVVYQRTKISQAAREYSLLSSPQKFTTSTRHLHPNVPVTDQVVEKTVYTTVEPFPNILRRSEIVDVETVTLSQVQAAIERTTRKTQELLALEKRAASGQEGAMERLTEDMLLSVDPNSDSSVSKYRNLLPTSEQTDAKSEELDYEELEAGKEPQLNPMQNALKVALLDHVLSIRKCLGLYTKTAYLATRAELVPRFEATFPLELALLFPDKNGILDDPSPRSSLEDAFPPIPVISEPNAATSALEADSSADDGMNPGTRRSSRRSFSFLRRLSNSHGTGPNVFETESANDPPPGRHSRRPSRGPSRDTSVSRRLSFFKSESQVFSESGQTTPIVSAAGIERSPMLGAKAFASGPISTGAGGAVGGGAGGGGTGLKKRLSFWKTGETQ